jgi:hypothetical protein
MSRLARDGLATRGNASLFFYRGHRIQRIERVGRANKEQAAGLRKVARIEEVTRQLGREGVTADARQYIIFQYSRSPRSTES